MNSKDFIKNNPELLERAKECKSKKDFITLAEQNGIKFDDMNLDQAYDVLNGNVALSEDSLESVAGGKGGGKDEVLPPKLEYLPDNQSLSAALSDMVKKKKES